MPSRRERKPSADQNATAAASPNRRGESDAESRGTEHAEQLWRSLIERARAGRTSGRIGQRYDGLTALRQAAGIRPTLEIRNEAIACMALVDLRPAPPGTPAPKQPGGTFNNAQGGVPRDPVTRVGRRPVRHRPRNPATPGARQNSDCRCRTNRGAWCGGRTANSWPPGARTWRFTSGGCRGGEPQTILHDGQAAAYDLAFSPSGRFLCSREIGGAVRFWDPVIGRQLVWSGVPEHALPLRPPRRATL